MKRINILSLAALALPLFAGCAEDIPANDVVTVSTYAVTEPAETSATVTETVSQTERETTFVVIELDAPKKTTEETTEGTTGTEISETETEKAYRTEKEYDIDLTGLGSTMLYTQVCNMIYEPDEYIGKSVKIKAPFCAVEEDGHMYYSVIVYDNTACCMQGIEFDLGDAYTYPDDYPEQGEDITVGGIFGSYQEGIATYYKLYGAVRIDG